MSGIYNFGQDKYMKNIAFTRMTLEESEYEAFFEHCEFCYAVISELPMCRHVGYYTGKYTYWVCEDCFDRFKEEYNWQMVDEEYRKSN